jgi:hypothetical protein
VHHPKTLFRGAHLRTSVLLCWCQEKFFNQQGTAVDTNAPLSSHPVTAPRRRRWLAPLLIAALVFVSFTRFGFYSIQPLGALPDGGTVLVWRRGGEPFFNSPDGACLRVQGSVSILCRLAALGQAPVDRVVLRLPYQHWAYLASTGGQTFEQ